LTIQFLVDLLISLDTIDNFQPGEQPPLLSNALNKKISPQKNNNSPNFFATLLTNDLGPMS
jgi:hypothetical protein